MSMSAHVTDVYAMYVRELMEAKRMHQIPWNWRYIQLRAIRHGCWELNLGHLEEQQVVAQPSPQLLYILKKNYCLSSYM